ncbi:hypothetical protein HK097_002412, partial [Rhizophlyctis rosea]
QRFATTEDGKVKWFAAPPLDVVDNYDAVHSLEYLVWRAKKVPFVDLCSTFLEHILISLSEQRRRLAEPERQPQPIAQ